jgi:hypothetical protein
MSSHAATFAISFGRPIRPVGVIGCDACADGVGAVDIPALGHLLPHWRVGRTRKQRDQSDLVGADLKWPTVWRRTACFEAQYRAG